MNQLHHGAKWQFRINGYILFGIIGLVLGFWIIMPLAVALLTLTGISGASVIITIFSSFFLWIALVIVLSEIYATMSYNRWFYEFNEDGLKLERGIIWKRYSNVPYERIQNVDITRGIIARMFGFSSVMIQTAGYSGQPYAEGYIPAVDMTEAEQIRTFVMKKITKRK